MGKTVTFANTQPHALHIGSKRLDPGDTREVDEDLIPPQFRDSDTSARLAGSTQPTTTTGAGGEPQPPERDPSYSQALELVVRERRASQAFLAEKLGVPAARARDLVKQLEDAGVVSAADPAGRRAVLQTPLGTAGQIVADGARGGTPDSQGA